MIPDVSIQQVGAFTIELRFERRIDPVIHDLVLCCAEDLQNAALDGIDTVFITYHSVGIHLDVNAPNSTFDHVSAWFEAWRRGIPDTPSVRTSRSNVTHIIPVLFGGADGPDLADMAAFSQISESEVVRMFCEIKYRVYMTGFIGGFPYLGIVPEAIRMPRRAQPRKRVAPGSVGIAAYQAGIYPMETPGGWNLIGRTEVDIPSLLLQPGDVVRFLETGHD